MIPTGAISAVKIAPSWSGRPATAQAITSDCAPTILPIAPPAGEPLVIQVRYVSPNRSADDGPRFTCAAGQNDRGRGTRLWLRKAHPATATDIAAACHAAFCFRPGNAGSDNGWYGLLSPAIAFGRSAGFQNVVAQLLSDNAVFRPEPCLSASGHL